MTLVEGFEFKEVQELPERKQKAELILEDIGTMFTSVAYGLIYNDSGYPGIGQARWENGTPIRTSSITDMVEFNGQYYIVTRNTIYRIIGRTLKVSHKEDV